MLVALDAWAREHDVAFVAVAVGEPLEKVSTFAKQKRIAYPVYVDEDFRLADVLGETRVPTTYVLDRFGRVAYAGGAVDDRSIDRVKYAAVP